MSELMLGEEVHVNLGGSRRQMLARAAESLYWLSRYVERSEHLARLIHENLQLLTDVGELAARVKHDLWQGILRMFGVDQLPEAQAVLAGTDEQVAQHMSAYMTFDAANAGSILSCIVNARENARSIRENISGEVWEDLNTLYWSLRGPDVGSRFEEAPLEVYRQVMNGSMLFQGLTDQTLAHSQGWLFMQLGKRLERLDITCRIIEVKFDILQRHEASLEPAERNIHWMSVLRSCASLEAYRRMHMGEMDAMRVGAFLVLEREFPRSIRACVHHAYDAVARISSSIRPGAPDQAERILGRLNTQLEYADAGEIGVEGFGGYVQKIRLSMAQAAASVKKIYFLH
ncbi:MAG TPA: alpha-E domain-containing protein [Tepidisphaeraceae bacterium]|jgi:uncharacterized alpha-E superfamily protein|nr:alpha-E domain-containing protein [Tepidisphaeraceae bacterium]